MNTEDRLRTELRETAERRNVDVDALYAATLERIESPVKPRGRHRAVLIAATAAAVVGIAAGGLWLDDELVGPGASMSPAGQGRPIQRPVTSGGPVDKEFSCAHTTSTNGAEGDPINVALPALHHMGIERSLFEQHGETGTLRLGPDDGTMSAKLEVRKDDGGWFVDRLERCTGPQGTYVPVPGLLELGPHGREMPTPLEPTGGEPKPTSSIVAVDDRPYYNRFGVIDHRTYYAYETESGVLVADYQDSYRAPKFAEYSSYFGLARHDRPLDDGFNFVPNDYSGPRKDFAFVVYYSTAPDTLTAELKDGTTIEADQIRGDDWRGTLYAVLAPPDQVDRFVLTRDGETTSYEPGEL
ncbi:hypothetical protein [Solicola gregarius]|uniref:Uncharacterized protein n=1 Tax=Solicola gregarius TaxID=2908642 RepID=A0AA46TJM1_9ACTN|nr:hypothetical protein [Solicola gregarius]UYM06490.1 hypothetical protein L0C25_05295 [Solicola gregarius]